MPTQGGQGRPHQEKEVKIQCQVEAMTRLNRGDNKAKKRRKGHWEAKENTLWAVEDMDQQEDLMRLLNRPRRTQWKDGYEGT